MNSIGRIVSPLKKKVAETTAKSSHPPGAAAVEGELAQILARVVRHAERIHRMVEEIIRPRQQKPQRRTAHEDGERGALRRG